MPPQDLSGKGWTPAPTTWSYKDGVRAAKFGEARDTNPCDPVAEAARYFQWEAGYEAALSLAHGEQP